MTKLLVLSDSHGGRTAIERVLMKEIKNINALIFLGDGLRDLELALTLYPKLRAYSVAGNCDYGALEPTDGLAAFDGVVIFYTHGHMYGAKYDLDTLADAASARGAEVALFGHTHRPVNDRVEGLYVVNPGTAGMGSSPTLKLRVLAIRAPSTPTARAASSTVALDTSNSRIRSATP